VEAAAGVEAAAEVGEVVAEAAEVEGVEAAAEVGEVAAAALKRPRSRPQRCRATASRFHRKSRGTPCTGGSGSRRTGSGLLHSS
jgi:hypothetical protein